MYGADYAWILQETFEHNRWWENTEASDCSLKNLHTAVENVLIVSSYNNIVGEKKSISGLVCAKRGDTNNHAAIKLFILLFRRTRSSNGSFLA